MSNKKDLEGIDGWLLLFIMSLFVQALQYLSFPFLYEVLEIYAYGIYILLGCLALLSAIFLIRYNKKGLTYAKIYLALLLVLQLYAFYLQESSIFSIIYPIIWLFYLSVSKRVKLNYIDKSVKKKIPKLDAIFFIIIFLGFASVNYFIALEDSKLIDFDIEKEVDTHCDHYCSQYENYISKGVNIMEDNLTFDCYCYDSNEEYIDGSRFSYG